MIGPYEVCIFVNVGPFEEMGALKDLGPKICVKQNEQIIANRVKKSFGQINILVKKNLMLKKWAL